MDFYYELPITRTLSFMTELTGFSVIKAVIELIFYVLFISCMSVGPALIFNKAGDKPIKAVIPIYNIYTMFKIMWSQKAFVVWFVPTVLLVALSRILSSATALPVVLFMLALLITVFFHILMCDKITRAFNEEIGTMIGLILLTPIYVMLIGNSNKEFCGKPIAKKRKPNVARKRVQEEKKTQKQEKLTRAEKKELKKQKQEERKREAMKKREESKREAMKKREETEPTKVKKSRKERKAEKKRFNREALGDGTSDADYYEERSFDAEGNIVTPTYVLSDKEKHILANLKREKASGNFNREVTEEERQALEKLRHIRSIGM